MDGIAVEALPLNILLSYAFHHFNSNNFKYFQLHYPQMYLFCNIPQLTSIPERPPPTSIKPILLQPDHPEYSGLNLNQDKATKPQTVQIVRQGEATPYWFKVNPLYYPTPPHRRHTG